MGWSTKILCKRIRLEIYKVHQLDAVFWRVEGAFDGFYLSSCSAQQSLFGCGFVRLRKRTWIQPRWGHQRREVASQTRVQTINAMCWDKAQFTRRKWTCVKDGSIYVKSRGFAKDGFKFKPMDLLLHLIFVVWPTVADYKTVDLKINLLRANWK